MINMNSVEAFYRHYQERSKTSPSLYRNSNTLITVVLPKDLLEYSNASAGHSGFGAGARPVGIRRAVKNAERTLAEIFSTPESLAKFIESSEGDGPAYVEGVRARHLASQTPKIPSAKEVFWKHYTKADLDAMRAKFGRDLVLQAYNTLNIEEFNSQFDLTS